MATRTELITVAGREVTISNPDKVYFPEAGYTKRDLVAYYLAVADGALRGAAGRPMALKRFVEGAAGDFFFQKRAPTSRPEWIETVELSFPSGRTADEVVVRDAAQLLWVVNLGCIDLNPHPVRAEDLDHPDELRVDLDPVPGVPWDHIRRGRPGDPRGAGRPGAGRLAQDLRLARHPHQRPHQSPSGRSPRCAARRSRWPATSSAACPPWPPASGGRRSGTASSSTTTRTPRTARSPRPIRCGPTPDARVSAPLTWEEVPRAELGDFTLATVPARFAAIGDPGAGIDEAVGSLESLLELSARHETEGLGDAPWPPNYARTLDEPPRVQPSKRRMSSKPLIEIGRAAKQPEAMEGLKRWKARHPDVWPHLEPADVLVDAMRGRYTTWTRIRVNLEHVPPELPPAPGGPGSRLRPLGRR